MAEVRLLGLCATAEADPFGEMLLRALSAPGPTGVRLDVYAVPSVTPPDSDAGGPSGQAADRALGRLVARSDGLLITAPESDSPPPEPLLSALNGLTWTKGTSPLAGKPVGVLTTTHIGTSPAAAYCETERMLLSAGADLVGPRATVLCAGHTLHEEPDGQVRLVDPAVTMRLLLHVHRIAAAARTVYRLPPAEGPGTWLL
ncbi:hypothetical protein [Streptomyces sp. NPDC088348]|uniref:hypothetical protein n=1 Tax=Streptomyces sp. NPDC088348 TaxID=3365853 RepID=UPI003821A4CF